MVYRLCFWRMAFWALATLVPIAAATAADAPLVAESDVHVERSGGTFTVDLSMHAPVEPAQAWAVLTDFEHMADFIPNLSSSQVLERSDTVLKVAQKGVARYGVFSTPFESVREIHLNPPHEIRAHGLGGNVQRMDSLMQLEAEGTGTRLTYHAEVLPGFWFPPLIGPALVRHETAEQFSAMLHEMLRRH
ncbi:carbon monoxide dehydrogenase subunit G [Rhodoferax ferrireducens]|uniref:Carbon monoxide dehydrogenase subunit G n=1 Tax=Rhodoferax ferrireducens TaxID=192843 RepID=A0ABU2C8T4_9BURK|nr:SRPBCC family protein [Rhodoferax ferrireducens]MDR7377704.1 carbon monoxide dehydrogenase subunit G [Rhodoferax ferrireducens]